MVESLGISQPERVTGNNVQYQYQTRFPCGYLNTTQSNQSAGKVVIYQISQRVIVYQILMLKENHQNELGQMADRMQQKYLAQRSKLLLKKQEEEMKKFIKSSKVKKQMKKPMEALKQIEFEQFDEKRKELEERKNNIISSMNYKQKEIETLLIESRDRKDYLHKLRFRIPTDP